MKFKHEIRNANMRRRNIRKLHARPKGRLLAALMFDASIAVVDET